MPTFRCDSKNLGSESARLLHGRGGLFEEWREVAVDWFAPVILITLYAEQAEHLILVEEVTAWAKKCSQIEAVVLQKRYLPKAPKETVFGKIPAPLYAREAGLKYHLALDRNQNHGFFLDMKSGRTWVREQSAGKRVLNLFAYTCSLSVAALAGGAAEVINLDMASGALATGRRNHQLNFENPLCQQASYLPHDLFKSWGRLVRGAPYDLVVIDPPSNQGKSFRAESHYPKILRRLPELLTPDSRILACLNAPHLGESFLTDLFANYRNLGRLPCAAGFEDSNPAAALKCFVFAP